MKQKVKFVLATPKVGLIALALLATSCDKKAIEDAVAAAGSSKYLYVTSGACFSGGNTTFTNTTASNLVYRVNLATGVRDMVLADYYASPSNPGDSPTGIANIDSNSIYVMVENTTTAASRRIEKIDKKPLVVTRIPFSTNTTILSTQLRHLLRKSNGDLLITRTTGIEYLTAANARNGAPFINPSAAPCATSNTMITKTIPLASAYGRYLFLHSAAGQNRIGIMSSAGGTTCMASGVMAAPNVASFPVAAFYDPDNSKVIVAYSGTTVATDINSIYAYPLTESAGAVSIGAGVKIYDTSLQPGTYPYLLYGISEMVYDSSTRSVYIATARDTSSTVVNYAIEKFTYDASQIGVGSSAGVLTRVGNTPFYPYGNDTKCISQMIIAD